MRILILSAAVVLPRSTAEYYVAGDAPVRKAPLRTF